MGFFDRLHNVVEAKANSFIDKYEDPIEQYDLEIKKSEDQLKQAKIECAPLLGSLRTRQDEISQLKENITQYETGIRKALSNNDEDKATKFLVKKKELDSQLSEAENNYTNLKSQCDTVQSNISTLEKRLSDLKADRNKLAAEYETAKAQKRVAETFSNIDTTNSNSNINRFREKVQKEKETADGLTMFNEAKKDTVENELNEYLKSSNDSPESLKSELDKYR